MNATVYKYEHGPLARDCCYSINECNIYMIIRVNCSLVNMCNFILRLRRKREKFILRYELFIAYKFRLKFRMNFEIKYRQNWFPYDGSKHCNCDFTSQHNHHMSFALGL